MAKGTKKMTRKIKVFGPRFQAVSASFPRRCPPFPVSCLKGWKRETRKPLAVSSQLPLLGDAPRSGLNTRKRGRFKNRLSFPVFRLSFPARFQNVSEDRPGRPAGRERRSRRASSQERTATHAVESREEAWSRRSSSSPGDSI